MTEALPRSTPPFNGDISRLITESTPRRLDAPRAPEGAPNVLLILLDDVGFGSSSAFGGPEPMPALDRVAANGDTANKVGTLALAVAAARGGVPIFVAAPTTTLDAAVRDGTAIPIEQRPPAEVTHADGGAGSRVAAEGVGVGTVPCALRAL